MRSAPLLLLAALVAFAAPRAEAQCTGTPVTVNQINNIPQADIDFLNANASTLTPDQIRTRLTTNPLIGTEVQFTAVVLTDPYNSGNASVTGGVPNRVHVFVRDVAALTQGNGGMGMQLVDGSGNGQILLPLVGDEITVCGVVSPFISNTNGSVQMQVAPSSVTITGTSYPASSPIRQPIVVTTDDIHDVVNGLTQLDWDRYAEFNSQFVRLENATLVQGVPAPSGRPDMLFQSPGSQTQVNSGTISLRFRNDRAGVYPNPPYNTRAADNPFTPPASGVVNVQGYLTYAGYDGPFDYTSPANANWVINPFKDADFVIAVAPPIVTTQGPTAAPTSSTAVTITATVVPGTTGNTIATVTLNYTTTTGGGGSVTMTNTGGDTYTGTIPAQASLSFVTYSVTATDNQGASITTASRSYRVLDGPISSFSLIQRTADGNPGPSPFYYGSGNNPGPAVPFAINAVVQTVFQVGTSYYAILQDDATLQPWTGVWAFFGSTDPGLTPGTRINITQAAINERFDVTQIQDIAYSGGPAGSPYPYKVLTTDLVSGAAGQSTAEQHEGMMVRFENVVITDPNADGPDTPGSTPNFGEWAFASFSSPAASFRGDDLSNGIDPTFNVDNFVVGQGRAFMQGAMYFSFGNYKLVPISPADIGMIITSAESGPNAGAARIASVSPNPVSGTAVVQFVLDTPGEARLSVYDVTGREVAVVAVGTFAAAAHEATVDVSALAAGVYVVRLQAEGAASTVRLSVVR